jgi:hypothetical protein
MSTTWQTTTVHVEQLPQADPSKLRALACWYRQYAERTGNPTIWEARLLTAKDLEARADHIERLLETRLASSDCLDLGEAHRQRLEGLPMSLAILYRHPGRPHEASITMIAKQARAAAMVDQLEKRGFVVDKITARSDRNRIDAPAPAVSVPLVSS